MSFEKNEKSRTINSGIALADYIVGHYKYGETVRYQDIEQITNERKGTQRYYAAIAKAKKLLEEKGKMICRAGGGDYKVAYPGDYSNAYAREIRLANNRVKHGNTILEHAPVNDMTISEKQVFDRVSDFHAALQARLAGSTVEVKKLVQKHPLQGAGNM